MYKYLFIITFLVLLSVSCTVNNNISAKPEWVYGKNKNEGICFVGSSRPHIRGKSYQRSLAVGRALEGIARQKNVKISTKLEHMMSGSSNTNFSKMRSFSLQTTSGETVNASIEDIWLDPDTSELFILMCEKP